MQPIQPKPTAKGNVPPRTLIIGCGYLGLCVAKKAFFSGHQVWATTRSGAKAQSLESQGIMPLIVDWTDHGTLCHLPEVDQILVSVGYDRRNRQSRYDTQVGGLGNLLDVVSPETGLCYISTTGVYHQTDGTWVDETSPTRPTRLGGQVHLQAEELLQQRRPDSNWTILRLAGIYGRDRVPRAADVIAGRPIASPRDGFLNLIHVEDAAESVMASWLRPNPTESQHRLYVVGDDHPVLRGEFYDEIARQCGAPPPRFVEPEADAPVTMRSETNKRISNRRMKLDLVPKLQFPTYREGLASVLS